MQWSRKNVAAGDDLSWWSWVMVRKKKGRGTKKGI